MIDSRVFAYVSDADSREISVLRLDPGTGELAPVENVSVAAPGSMPPVASLPLAISPDRRFLYAALRSQPYSVTGFAINSMNGRLTRLASAPLPESMAFLSTDRTGRFLFAASIPESKKKPRSGLLSVSSIGCHGFVQPPHQIMRTEPKMQAILTDPGNRFVFATSCDADVVLRLRFDADAGTLSSDSLSPVRVKPQAGPRHFVFHPNGRHVYLLNEADASVYGFRYEVKSGAWEEHQIVSALAPGRTTQQPHAGNVKLTPDGRFLYASELSSNTLTAFQVDLPTGTLAYAGTFPTLERPRSFDIDPFGCCLLVASQGSGSLESFAMDGESGRLDKSSEYPVGRMPSWIEIIRL
jgi:6-phosphogluconolactonase